MFRILAELLTICANCGCLKTDNIQQTIDVEVATSLAFSDKTYTQLEDVMPTKTCRKDDNYVLCFEDSLARVTVHVC
jgi:uncharacterized Zn finger protein